ARSGTEVSFEMPFLQFGRVVRGVIQGESHPQEFIPRLVDFLMQGKMPVERMMTFYPLAEINRAAQDSSQGTTIKPVLRMPSGAGRAGHPRTASRRSWRWAPSPSPPLPRRNANRSVDKLHARSIRA